MSDKRRLYITVGIRRENDYYNTVQQFIDVPVTTSAGKVASVVADIIPDVDDMWNEVMKEQEDSNSDS